MKNGSTEIEIIINTSIPGFQTITYKPAMTIPGDTSNSVQFNPLVKLNKSVIDSLPKNIQVKEFFNRGLFQSLINAHGLVRSKSLVEATNEGYIDNNIKITLDTLFPTNGVLYITNQPYAIADVLWKKGDWKIDKKVLQVPQVNFSRINDPYLLTTLAREQLLSGESELKALPKDVLYGPNYVAPIAGVTVPQNLSTVVTPIPHTLQPPENSQLTDLINKQVQEDMDKKKLKPYKPIPLPVPVPLPQPSEQSQQIISQPPQKPLKPQQQNRLAILPPPPPQLPLNNNRLAILQPSQSPQLQIEDGYEYEVSPSTYTVKLITSKSSQIFRNYFLSNDYYYMVNYLVQNMNKQGKEVIDNILKNTTGVAVKPSKNLSKTAYNITVGGTKIYTNTGLGDCFFIAVADGINYYNLNSNVGDKIYYNNYGTGNMIFTQKILRTIVADFIISLNSTVLNDMIEVSKNNATLLNDDYNNYKNNLPRDISEQDKLTYLSNYIENLYSSNNSFLIKKSS